MSDYIDRIETLPSIEAFLAVRCKDCAYWSTDGDLWPTNGYCKRFGISNRGPDFFCAEGKKEEDMGNREKVGEWIALGHQSGMFKHPWSEDYKCPFCGYEQYTLLTEPPNRCPICLAHLRKKIDADAVKEFYGVDTVCEVKP